MSLEVGKTYKHIKAGGVIEVLKEEPNRYIVKISYNQMNATLPFKPGDFFMKFQLPKDKAPNYKEVVVDSDGLVYDLEVD